MKTQNKTYLSGVSLLLFIGAALALSPLAQGAEYLGAKKCSICHKKPEVGNQYAIWLETSHAKAFERLGSDEAKAVGAKLGVADPQTSGKCLKCHSTAYAITEEQVSQSIKVEEGVSCESCHGPGKDYAKKTIMQDQAKAVEAGLILPDEKACLKCHNSESPTYKPFDYAERWEKIKHPRPE